MELEEIHHRFRHHPPQTEQRVQNHEAVRHLCERLAVHMDDRLPDGREKSLVLTKIEEAMFWANAALARAEEGGDA